MGGNPSLLYPTTKGAIIQMTRAMAAHHGQENIRVNCVCPGMVYTPMTRGRGMTEEMRQARMNQNLMKMEGTGWDVGYGEFNLNLAVPFRKTDVVFSAILYLVSKEARWITGVILPVDGGVSSTTRTLCTGFTLTRLSRPLLVGPTGPHSRRTRSQSRTQARQTRDRLGLRVLVGMINVNYNCSYICEPRD